MNDNPQKMPPVPPFVRFVASAVPMVFDNSLSYYEALCALWKYIQSMTDVINNNATLEEEYIEKFNELKSFVDSYFDNLDVQDEINNKLDEMAESGVLADIMATYAQTKVDYFYIGSTSTSADIISAFASPKSKVIEFANGTYTVNQHIILSSNTTVNLNGATLQYSSGTKMIIGYALDSTYTGYNGVHNVTFNNGAIKLPVALMHNVGITFNNVEFKDTSTHAIQIAASKDILINNCIFNGVIKDDAHADQLECIQLEGCIRAGQPYLNDSSSASYDETPNYGITIKDCVFKRGDWNSNENYLCIGNHSDDYTNKYYNKNISILNCRFESAYTSQLTITGYDGGLVEGNQFQITDNTTDTNQMNIRFRWLNKNVVIRNNTFEGGDYNIGTVNIEGISGITVENNTFTTEFDTAGSNINIRAWSDSKIVNNTFNKARFRNISVDGNGDGTLLGENIVISGNTFDSTNIYGTGDLHLIRLLYTANVSIKDNVVKLHNTTLPFVYIDTAKSSGYSYRGNVIKTTLTTTAVKEISASTLSTLDASNIYGVPILLFSADSAVYAAIDAGTLNLPITQFNTLILEMNETNTGRQYFMEVHTYGQSQKINGEHLYNFYCQDANNTNLKGRFLTGVDNAFSYSSQNSNLTLRFIHGVNH